MMNIPRRFLTCLNGLVLGRIALLLAGFLTVTKNASPFKHEPKLKTKSGSAVYCNLQSPMDVVYLIYRFSPVFLRLIEFTTQPKKHLYVQLTNSQIFWSLFSRTTFMPIIINSPEELTNVRGVKLSLQRHIENSRQNIHGPCVVFYEGVPTNGQGTLAPDYDSLMININRPRFIFNLDYYSPGVPLYNTARNQLFHMFLIFCNWHNSVQVFSTQINLNSTRYSLTKSFEQKIEGIFGKKLIKDVTWRNYGDNPKIKRE